MRIRKSDGDGQRQIRSDEGIGQTNGLRKTNDERQGMKKEKRKKEAGRDRDR